MLGKRIVCCIMLGLGLGCAQDKVSYYRTYFEDARLLSTESREQADQMNVAESDIPALVYAMVGSSREDGILLLLAQKGRLPEAVRNELYAESLRRLSVPLVDAMALSMPPEERRRWAWRMLQFLERNKFSSQFVAGHEMAGTFTNERDERGLPGIESVGTEWPSAFYNELPVDIVWETLGKEGNYVFGQGKVKVKQGEWRYGSDAGDVVGAYILLAQFFKAHFSVHYMPESHTIRAVMKKTSLSRDAPVAPFFTIEKKGDVYSVLPGQTQEDRWYSLCGYAYPH